MNEKIIVNGYYFNAEGQILLSCETDSANSVCVKEPHWDQEKWSLLPTPFLFSKTLPVLQLFFVSKGGLAHGASHRTYFWQFLKKQQCVLHAWGTLVTFPATFFKLINALGGLCRLQCMHEAI